MNLNLQLNTFQCVLTTDPGKNSFVIFLYPEGGIQWIKGDSSFQAGRINSTCMQLIVYVLTPLYL